MWCCWLTRSERREGCGRSHWTEGGCGVAGSPGVKGERGVAGPIGLKGDVVLLAHQE